MADGDARINAPSPVPGPVLVLQNDPNTPAGLIETEAARLGFALDVRRTDKGEALPIDARGHTGLVVLGGPMSANDEGPCPFIRPTLDLIRAFARLDRPVLGVCLGAQLIARAFGGDIRPMTVTEFGFCPQTVTEDGRRDRLLAGHGPAIVPMHWHQDEAALPDGAVLLATGPTCANQAFRIGQRVHGFQFHFEVDAAIVRRWMALRAAALGEDETAFLAGQQGAIERHAAAAQAFGRDIAARWLRSTVPA